MLSHSDADYLFRSLDTVILDELHALAPSKRGDLLSLALARLSAFAPNHIRIGLSATVARPTELRAFLMPQAAPEHHTALADVVTVKGGAEPEIRILELEEDPVPGVGTRPATPSMKSTVPSSVIARPSCSSTRACRRS